MLMHSDVNKDKGWLRWGAASMLVPLCVGVVHAAGAAENRCGERCGTTEMDLLCDASKQWLNLELRGIEKVAFAGDEAATIACSSWGWWRPGLPGPAAGGSEVTIQHHNEEHVERNGVFDVD